LAVKNEQTYPLQQASDALRTQIWLARAYYGCGRAIGKIGKRKKLNTTRLYAEIGGEEVAR
jgi:hypothetical protein